MGALGRAKFHPNRCTGAGYAAPKSRKFPFFDNPSSRRGENFDRFSISVMMLLCAQLPCISVLNLTCFASQVTVLLLRNRTSVIKCHLSEIFPCILWEKYAMDRENDRHLLEWSRRPLPPQKVRGRSNYTHAGCRCENMVLLWVGH